MLYLKIVFLYRERRSFFKQNCLNMNTTVAVGIMSSVLTAISMLPQLIKIIREKKAENISYSMLIVLTAGLCGWIWYGILKTDYILICANAVSLCISVMLGIFAYVYKQ